MWNGARRKTCRPLDNFGGQRFDGLSAARRRLATRQVDRIIGIAGDARGGIATLVGFEEPRFEDGDRFAKGHALPLL
jgi:hypothetical protein